MESRSNKKLRILFAGFAYIVDVYQSKLKAIYDTGGSEVAWLAPVKWKMRSWNRDISLKVKYREIQVYPAKIGFLNGVNGGYLYPTFSILNAIAEFKPDIMHYEQEVFSLSAFQIALFARVLKIPLTVFCWENINRSLPFYRRWTTRFVMDSSSAIVAGNNDAAQILRQWGFKRDIIIMPQIGVDTTLFFPRSGIKKNHDFRIGFVGRLVPEKGIDLLFDAAKNLIESGRSLLISICGSGSHESYLRQYAEALNIGSYITWLSFVQHDDIPNIMAQMDVVVLPSRILPGKWMEQFGHVLIEAMALGIPVVGSDTGAIPEVIGRNDLIFPENDSTILSNILERLMVDTTWRNNISRSLQDRVFQEYTDERIAERLISIWTKVINAGQY